MSPLWRDEIAVAFAPGQLVFARMRRGLRPQCVAEARFHVEEFLLTDWRPAVALLADRLGETEWQGASVRIVLGNHFTRYAIVPWASGITSEDERLAHARICLAEVYGGNVTDQWRIAISHAGPGEARVACAVHGDLVDALRQTIEARGVRLVSLQPQLVASYNTWLPRLADVSGWFVNIDEGSLAAARLGAGGWERVYSARIGTDWAVELNRLRTFGRLAARDSSHSRVFVAAPAWLRDIASSRDDGIEWLCDDAAADGHEAAALKRLYA